LLLAAGVVYLTYRPFEVGRRTEDGQGKHGGGTDDRERTVEDGRLGAEASPVASLRPQAGPELRATAILLGVSALWLSDSWHGLDPAVPALIGAILMITPGIGVLTWPDVERGVGGSMIFVIASSLSLAHAVVGTGAAAWLGAWLVAGLSPFAGSPLLLVVLLVAVSLVARVLLSSIVAYLTVLIPVVTALAEAIGLNPLVCGLLVTLAGDSVVYFVAQSASSLMPFEYGYLTAADVLRLGVVMSVVVFVVALGVAIPYWTLVGQPLLLPAR
ncbi:MAG: anion permease, partial [Chloroflexi bacterium]|nr:anion permease [Chloroflexota bacterium]